MKREVRSVLQAHVAELREQKARLDAELEACERILAVNGNPANGTAPMENGHEAAAEPRRHYHQIPGLRAQIEAYLVQHPGEVVDITALMKHCGLRKTNRVRSAVRAHLYRSQLVERKARGLYQVIQ